VARRDRWSAVGLALLAAAYLLAGRAYPLDTLAVPGPGVVPLVAGLVLLALAAWQLAAASRPVADEAETGGAPLAFTPLAMATVLVLYAATLPRLGFGLAAFGLVFAAARLMGLGGWWRPTALALAATVLSHVIFVTWRGVPLP
jgi:hypothetical protein